MTGGINIGGAWRLFWRLALGLVLLIVALLLLFRIAAAVRERSEALPASSTLVATPLGRVAVALSGPAAGTPVMLIPGHCGVERLLARRFHASRRAWLPGDRGRPLNASISDALRVMNSPNLLSAASPIPQALSYATKGRANIRAGLTIDPRTACPLTQTNLKGQCSAARSGRFPFSNRYCRAWLLANIPR